jgi:hypothetical protein
MAHLRAVGSSLDRRFDGGKDQLWSGSCQKVSRGFLGNSRFAESEVETGSNLDSVVGWQ